MAEIAYQPAQVLTITNPAKNLDPIDVIFLDHSPGRGRVIINSQTVAAQDTLGIARETLPKLEAYRASGRDRP